MGVRDFSEYARREQVKIYNSAQLSREDLEKVYGRVYDSTELASEYVVTGFLAPYVVVERKSDKAKGTLAFQHCPRFYWGFISDDVDEAEKASEIKIQTF